MTRPVLQNRAGSGAGARGVATGLVLMAVFTLLWGSWTVQGLGRAAVLTVLLFTTFAVVFFLRGVGLFRALRHRADVDGPAEDPPDDPRSAVVGRRFLLVVAAETIAIAAISATLGLTGHDRYLNPAIGLIVGLHFLALAWVFPHQRAVNITTGAVLSVAGAAALLVVAGDMLRTDLTWSLVAVVAASCTTAQGLTMLAARRRLFSDTGQPA